MLAVMVFESCKVPFETIGSRRDGGIVEVIKHMWQGIEQHASGVYEVADYPAAFGGFRQFGAIAIFPCLNSSEKSISLNRSTNRCNLEKYLPQMFGVWARWIPTTPHKPLSLYMYEATLDDNRRPHSSKHFDSLGVAVGSAADWDQPVDLKRLEEPHELQLRVFVNAILTMDHSARSSIHDCNEAAALIQECAVEDQVSRKERFGQCRGPVEPVMYDTPQRRRAEATEIPDLAHAEPFAHPSLEPYPLVAKVFVDPPPAKRSAAVETPPPLAAVAVMTVPFDFVASTSRTMFFSGSYRNHGTTSIMESTSHCYNYENCANEHTFLTINPILSKAKDPAETPEESGFFAALRMTDRCLHGFLEVPYSFSLCPLRLCGE